MKVAQFYFALFFLAFNVANAQEISDPIPDHDSFTVESKAVSETRVINVWLPPNYNATASAFPVMYIADGGLKEDFPHIANTLSELVKANKIAPLILVGIENTQRRRDLTGPTQEAKDKEIAPIVGGSQNFRNFINDELFAEINKRYRTTNQKGIIGESLSGLFVVETFLLTPNMFDYYIAFDPSIWWNDYKMVKHASEYLAKFPESQKRLWFAGSADMSKYTKRFEKILKSQKLPNLKWQYSDEPNEQHSTIFRGAKEKAILFTLGK